MKVLQPNHHVFSPTIEGLPVSDWAEVLKEVENGIALPGLYPPNAEAKARYEAWKKGKD